MLPLLECKVRLSPCRLRQHRNELPLALDHVCGWSAAVDAALVDDGREEGGEERVGLLQLLFTVREECPV